MRYLETSLEKIARILSRQYNVDVVFEGQQAYTNGQRIVLPFFQNLTEELEADLNGYLDHEVAHVKFTTFSEGAKVISAYHKELLNGVEDVRIERLMMQEYPGTAYHIIPMNKKLFGRISENWFSRPWPIRFLLAVMRVMEGKDFPKDVEIERHLKTCEEEISALNSCRSTQALRLVTEKIVRKLIKDREEEKNQAQEQKKGGEGQKSEKSQDQKQGQSGQKSQSQDKENQKGEDKKKEETSGAKDKQEKEQKSAGAQGQEKSENQEGQGEQESSGQKEKPTPSQDQKKAKAMSKKKESSDHYLTEKNEDAFEEFEIDVHRMINNELKDKIQEEKEQTKNVKTNYEYRAGSSVVSIPFSTRFDRVIDYSGKDNGRYSEVKREVRPLVNTLKTNLEKIFKSVENAKWKSEREQGLLNARALSQLASNPNYRTVFKELTKFETDKVAVSIVIDLSGSMSGDKIYTGQRAGAAMGEALNALGIKNEITGFHTSSDYAARTAAAEAGVDFSRFNRVNEILEHHIFKSFECSSLVGLSNIRSGNNNNDGESIMWAAKRLAMRPEKRKILLVMSDGMPHGEGNSAILQSDLRVKLAQIENFGIEIVGIGILTEHVKHFYKDYAVINNLKELTTTCLKKLSTILTKNLPLRR